MKKTIITNGNRVYKWIALATICPLWLVFGCRPSVALGCLSRSHTAEVKDTSVSAIVQAYLSASKSIPELQYPGSVQRFYNLNNNQAAWVKEATDPKQTWEAMMLLDCVLQYGLFHADYHPKELLYQPLHDMLETQGKISNRQKAKFDILLTDALITLLNNLHYGKLNPVYSADKIDAGGQLPFYAESALMNARTQKNFMSSIESVQPKSKIYHNMQDRMRQLKGVYQEDCYQMPEDEVRKIAINLERLRWAEIDEDTYVIVNIPAFTLRLVQPDTVYEFKVVVGKTSAPTPTLASDITYFTTFPEWKIPQQIFVKELLPKALRDTAYLVNNHYSIYAKDGSLVTPGEKVLKAIARNPKGYYAHQSSGCDNALGQIVFRFANVYDIYLHDTPEQQLFKNDERAFSHSCIRVEKAAELAGLLLKDGDAADKKIIFDKAMKRHLTRNISLKKSVPIKVVYLTCIIKQGTLITFKDIYGLDKPLEMALYNTTETLTKMN